VLIIIYSIIISGRSGGWSSKCGWYIYGVSTLRSVGIGGSLNWLEDTEEIWTDEYDRFDASVDQVISDAGLIRFGWRNVRRFGYSLGQRNWDQDRWKVTPAKKTTRRGQRARASRINDYLGDDPTKSRWGGPALVTVTPGMDHLVAVSFYKPITPQRSIHRWSTNDSPADGAMYRVMRHPGFTG
jgi:hypothetical protein